MASKTVLSPILNHAGIDNHVPVPLLPVTFWHAGGAILLLAAVLLSGHLQRWLSSRMCLFLGYLSFPLYLTHGNVINLTAKPVFAGLSALGFGSTTAFLGALMVFFPSSLAIAYSFAMLV
jgi:peptidoglycan/LPS O-acetylase OafA/YrhL